MKTPPPEATKTVYPILRQIVNLIPPNIFHAAASATKDLSRVFTPWSRAVALIYQHIVKTWGFRAFDRDFLKPLTHLHAIDEKTRRINADSGVYT